MWSSRVMDEGNVHVRASYDTNLTIVWMFRRRDTRVVGARICCCGTQSETKLLGSSSQSSIGIHLSSARSKAVSNGNALQQEKIPDSSQYYPAVSLMDRQWRLGSSHCVCDGKHHPDVPRQRILHLYPLGILSRNPRIPQHNLYFSSPWCQLTSR